MAVMKKISLERLVPGAVWQAIATQSIEAAAPAAGPSCSVGSRVWNFLLQPRIVLLRVHREQSATR
jgi:hypothetical protein